MADSDASIAWTQFMTVVALRRQTAEAAGETFNDALADLDAMRRRRALQVEQAAARLTRLRESARSRGWTLDFNASRHLQPGVVAALPIECIGESVQCCYYLDLNGLRRSLRTEQHDRAGILSLFAGDTGRIPWLPMLWPDDAGGWDEEHAAETLMNACADAGEIDPIALGFVINLDHAFREFPDVRRRYGGRQRQG